MSAEERLAALYAEMVGLGLPCLVMGGHAVRFYGIDRTTVDFDFHVALEAEAWGGIAEIFGRARVLAPEPSPPAVSGALCPAGGGALRRRDGRLPRPFGPDPKQGDRARGRLATARGPEGVTLALRELRSRRGFESARAAGLFSRSELVASAARGPGNALAAAFLSPWVKGEVHWPEDTAPSVLEIGASLATVAPGSARHLALVEAVRRLHHRSAMAADRADKEAASPRPAG